MDLRAVCRQIVDELEATVRAKSAYSDLLTLWKNADADISVVKEARAEYARLP